MNKKIITTIISVTLAISSNLISYNKVHATNINTINNQYSDFNYVVSSKLTTLRKTASNYGLPITTIQKGTTVNVIQEGNAWCKVSYNNKIGFIKTTDLKKENTQTTISTGSININYLDSQNNKIYKTQEIKDLEFATYTVEARQIEGYEVIGEEIKSVNITRNNPIGTINFIYQKEKLTTGNVVINYIDEDSNEKIEDSKEYIDLELETYELRAKEIEGYDIVGEHTKSVTLTETNPTKYINFIYKKQELTSGNITINYIDEDSNEKIEDSKEYTDLELGIYEFRAKEIEGYDIVGEHTKSVTLTETNPTKNINFIYQKQEFKTPETDNENNPFLNHKKGLFSWEKQQVSQEMREDTLFWLNKFKIDELYQGSLFEIDKEDLLSFSKDINEQRVDLYYLTGNPSWFNNSENFKKHIDLVKNHNKKYSDEYQIKGIVFDVEPWSSDFGSWSEVEYANIIKEAYVYAKKCNVEMIVVIPSWLQVETSEIIIKNSDKVIVTNYNIENPIKFIKEEIEIAQKYNKNISTAAETVENIDNYGVDSSTTYYYVGAEKLKEDWNSICENYNYEGLEFSLYNMDNIKEFYELHKNSIESIWNNSQYGLYYDLFSF